MRQIRLRRILPTVQLALFLILFWLGKTQEAAYYGEWDAQESALTEHAKLVLAAKAGAAGSPVGWDLRHMWDGYQPPALKLNTAINLPALLLGVPLLLIAVSVVKSETATTFMVAIVVFLFWYLVGRSFDRTSGPLAPALKVNQSSTTSLAVWVVPLVFAVVALNLFYKGSRVDWLWLSLAFWSSILALFQIRKLRRLRILARSRLSPPNPQ